MANQFGLGRIRTANGALWRDYWYSYEQFCFHRDHADEFLQWDGPKQAPGAEDK